MRHFFSVNQLKEDEIIRVLHQAEQLRLQQQSFTKQLFAANLFFEPSTRTKMSFIVAERKLGMDVLDFHADYSSTQKGESLYDTAKTFEAIGANLLVIRHQADYWMNELKNQLSIPIINAGAGKAEHPTQCMLDLLTIYQEFQQFHGIKVVIAGDILHSRVANSNAHTLRRLGAEVYFAAADGCKDNNLDFPYLSIDEAVECCDVLMLLRIQHERHREIFINNKDYLRKYGLTKERERKMHPKAIILHPAPINRGVEIDTELVECERSRIFKQMNNGVYTRMAIIKKLLQERGIIHETIAEKRKKTVING
ncbi:MAG: aspartate carbamoyltransferase catalytic subunit [Bacillota bacterium]|uniref:Aspartate carbamoyltransferase n=1 Tax=Virgibacillus salarius TaxID=447199 RepID=A0A941DRM2_9BACI|nr:MULTISPECIES: aspartate carbamoyltransferase catalytic subunit [Bacillaceae]NAZ08025.1 aspartate carbamoyltransferase catalytic subunit [Agaribacter marinus]MBR7795310.1 aspartate carbamoyltransferase catalytic subunit [Virgibacillus salarius]MCC2252519.1 aspartate carbamoyltransferase catalytic subunit [Virgibacillus sp. AGTR]MDY7045613.1 aspartate carbamoyltransferase catalytic subunit [Virgibacillus sp. M23]QRZ16895.1 aspartate carbamoyltransferase catalytic subunit [Virgibacillus sp. AG